MAWEKRPDSAQRYYTRSKRIAGRVRKEYLGNGQAAQRAAAADDARRKQRAEQRRAEKLLQTQRDAMYTALLAPLRILETICQIEMQRELEAAGYHQHNRGEWRKRRGTRNSASGRVSTISTSTRTD